MDSKDLNKQLSDFLKKLNYTYNKTPNDEKLAWGLIIVGVILIIIALILW